MDLETLQKLNEPIVVHYMSLNLATPAALDNFVDLNTSFLILGGSVVLFLFLFVLNITLVRRQARAFYCAPRRFLNNKPRQFYLVTDKVGPNSDSLFLITTREDFTALRTLAKEA